MYALRAWMALSLEADLQLLMGIPIRRSLHHTALALSLALSPALLFSQEAPPPPAGESSLPSLGDVTTQSLSPRAERRLGDRIMRSILQDPQIVDDPLMVEYIDTQWSSLLRSARQRGEISPELNDVLAWSTFLVRDRSINAFALPGGYVGIHLGLIAGTRSRDELASVLAHEMSHVTQRHIARMMGQAERTSWVSMASMVLGALAASRSPEAAQALILGGQGLSAQTQLNFSRDMEREADRIGYGVLTEAGYAPAGMMQMFEQLQQAARLNDDNSFPYLRTHPLTVERIGEARSRMGMQGLGHTALIDSGVHHALMTARAKVLMDTRSASLQPFMKGPDASLKGTALLVHHYTRVVTATQLKDRGPAAVQSLTQLWSLLGDTKGLDTAQSSGIQRLISLGEIEYLAETDRQAQAQALLKRLGTVNRRPEMLLQAQIAMASPAASGNTPAWREAASQLQTLTAQQPDDATAWSLLTPLWTKLAQPLRAIRAEAEASAARGDLQGAIDRVTSARKRFAPNASADLIELSVMDARLQTWRKALKEDERED
jgi:beta-barrel assembly-enhancing protease